MDVTFLEKQLLFQKISLQWKNIIEEGNSWDVILNKMKTAISNIACEIGDLKSILPNTSESSTRVEIPTISKKQNTELLTYSRMNHKKK